MKNITIIHNPHCSKSREALKLIEEHGYTAKIIRYLDGELTRELLEEVLKRLQLSPKEILRTKEEDYKNLHLNLDNDTDVIESILKFPKLLERPIVMNEKRAIIGRPPEAILELLK